MRMKAGDFVIGEDGILHQIQSVQGGRFATYRTACDPSDRWVGFIVRTPQGELCDKCRGEPTADQLEGSSISDTKEERQ